jgi:hypothetical protein
MADGAGIDNLVGATFAINGAAAPGLGSIGETVRGAPTYVDN